MLRAPSNRAGGASCFGEVVLVVSFDRPEGDHREDE